MINIHIIENIWLLLLSVIHASRSMLCARAEVHRRGVVHRMERRHGA
jgi:hypothetical protein